MRAPSYPSNKLKVNPLRRVVALPAVLCLSLLTLTACGDDDSSVENAGSVTVSGEVGQAPEVEYDGRITRSTTDVEVLTEGSGEEIAEGDTAFVHFYIGNGYTGEKAASTYDVPEGGKKTDVKPQMVTVTGETLEPIREALVGARTGARVLVMATPEDAYEEQGNPNIGIGNLDAVVFVVDVLAKVLPAPSGTEKPLPAGMPTLVESDGKPTGFDFSEAARSAGDRLRTIPLVQGDGPAIKKGSQVALRYLGQQWGRQRKFDDNYDATAPGLPDASGSVSAVTIPGSLIEGWNQGLIGVKAGSRVLLVIPEALGYGPKPKKDDGKPHGDLVFVIDVLGVV